MVRVNDCRYAMSIMRYMAVLGPLNAWVHDMTVFADGAHSGVCGKRCWHDDSARKYAGAVHARVCNAVTI